MNLFKRIRYNSPVVLTFALVSLISLLLGYLTNGMTTTMLFEVYRAPLSDPLTYLRMFLHVLGHSGYKHYIGNMVLILILGPILEEKYGSRTLLGAIFLTALISGLFQFICFPNSALLGASGIVFMMIMLVSFTGVEQGTIPLTLILVAVIYLGGQISDSIFLKDNVSQITHIIGGICGTVFGFVLTRNQKRRR